MANAHHLDILRQGADVWNSWRLDDESVCEELKSKYEEEKRLFEAEVRRMHENPDFRDLPTGLWVLALALPPSPSSPDFSNVRMKQVDLCNSDLAEMDLQGYFLREADLHSSVLVGAQLQKADLRHANLSRADLAGANLTEARLNNAYCKKSSFDNAILDRVRMDDANCTGATFAGTSLKNASISQGRFRGAKIDDADFLRCRAPMIDFRGGKIRRSSFRNAQMSKGRFDQADLSESDFYGADLTHASFRHANLSGTRLISTDIEHADLTHARVYGVAAWNIKAANSKQQNLVITGYHEPEITVDNIEVAQFVYLMLRNEKIRDVIDTIAAKAVLILGRFSKERIIVLDALRDELRQRNYLPILFDFDKPTSRDLTATVATLAHMARFIIADVTDPSSIPHELGTVVPTTPVPLQPILLSGETEFEMLVDLRRRYGWVLPTHRYNTSEQLIAELSERVIRPAEAKVLELRRTVQA